MNDLKEIGGFIVSADPFVQHDTSLSGNGTVNSPLGVVPGYNETVLYSGAATSSVALSESLTNFERIKIKYSIDGMIWHEFDAVNGNNRDCFFGGGTTAQSWFGNIFLTFSNTTITVPTAYCYFLTGANITYNTGYNTYAQNSIGAVVGINRKQ